MLGAVLTGRTAGTALVWSRPIFPPHEAQLEVQSVEQGPEGELAFFFKDDPHGGPLRLYQPRDVVLDEHGLRVGSAARVEWGELSAERVPPGWIRLKVQGRTTEFEVGRREALQLEPPLGAPPWTLGWDEL